MSRIRRSVPTVGAYRYWDAGWAYVMPDFDNKNHSIIEWLSEGPPAEPCLVGSNRVPEASHTENANERALNGT